MLILAIDTAAEFCAACVYDAAALRELGREAPDIGKGHAERLIGVIETALARAGVDKSALDAIAVSVGPGSFTGVRIGVATARGLALALSIRAAGVPTLAAVASEARARHPFRPVLAVLDAKRDELYVALYGTDGGVVVAPRIASPQEASALQQEHDAVLAGSGARIVAGLLPAPPVIAGEARTGDIATYARLAAQSGFAGPRPSPLYLRGADAKPQAGFALPRTGS